MEFTQFPHWPKQHARTHGAASQFTLPSLGARGSSGCRRLTGERAVARARERASALCAVARLRPGERRPADDSLFDRCNRVIMGEPFER